MMTLLWMTIDRHPESLKTLIRERLHSTGFEILEASYDSLDVLSGIPLEAVDAVLMAPARYFPTEHMDRLTNCRLIQIWSSGYDKFNIDDARDRNIPVANNHGANAVSVAEHAILMMLGVSRRIPEMHERVITGNWAGNDHGMSSYSLNGKTLGIVGLGNIGRLVATRAEPLGMSIRFADPNVPVSPEAGWVKSNFDDLLGEVDYLSFHVHLNDSTRGMLNMENIGKLAQKPFIINVSRAELVNYDALLAALDGGLVKGAAIDAHYEEPTRSDDRLFSFPNILVSPHIAGSTVDSYYDTIDACISNISTALEGRAPQGLLLPR
jgi:phosphoglycerate dehydrogenase-like enzyme